MAMDIISVQATSGASESAFSTSERVLSIPRTRLTLASLEMCMCLRITWTLKSVNKTDPVLKTPKTLKKRSWMPRCNKMKPFHYPMKKLHEMVLAVKALCPVREEN
nr:zinc finger BED domain-containing protein RICESLEEPER 2 [Tanacetum cinerariifolium]